MPEQTHRGPQPGPGLVDVHHHLVPPAWLDERYDTIAAINRRISALTEWTPQRSVEAMDRNGVATAMLSVTSPGIWSGEASRSAALARACNEYAAGVARDLPGRFGVFAALPLPDVAASLAEIAFALDVLGADGIGLMTSYDTRWPGDPAFAPVFDELNRRRAVVYVHPTAADCCIGLIPDVSPAMVEFPFDTTRAIVSLLTGGTFARCPDIRWIFSHGGGALPMLAQRIASNVGSSPRFAGCAPGGVLETFGRLHYDTAQAANPISMAALRALAAVSQILFGSDYPMGDIERTVTGLGELDLAGDDLTAIGRGNAHRLFPRLAGA